MEILYIIGNGFDLNIGLKTSYLDFYNYYNSLSSTKDKVKFLKESISKDFKTWADLEIGFGEFTSKLNDTAEFNETFEDISDQLATYLAKEENSFDFSLIDKGKFYEDLSSPEKYLPNTDLLLLKDFINNFGNQHINIRIITLNYTKSIEKIIDSVNPNMQIGSYRQSYQIKLKEIQHLHGYIDERMIMGVNDISQIKNENFHNDQEILEAFVKPTCNEVSKSNVDRICSSLINSADLICIFGSSIGETDKIWWNQIGNRLRKGKKLIIFQRGEEINKRRLYKILPIERQVKNNFLEKTNLSDADKNELDKSIFVAFNTDMFSHMRITK